MKTQITITLDWHLREELKKIAKNMWTNSSNLINMLVANLINTWEMLLVTEKQWVTIEKIKWSEEFIWSELHNRWRKILKSINKWK